MHNIPTSYSHNGYNTGKSWERKTDSAPPENSEVNPTKIEQLEEETPNDVESTKETHKEIEVNRKRILNYIIEK